MSKEESNKQFIKKFLDQLSAGNNDVVLSMMNDSATWQVPLRSKALGALAEIKTKPMFAEQLKGTAGALPKGVTITVKGMTAEGDRVAVEAESYGTTVNGKVYNNLYHFLFEMREGKVQAAREYCDFLHVKEVLGDLM